MEEKKNKICLFFSIEYHFILVCDFFSFPQKQLKWPNCPFMVVLDLLSPHLKIDLDGDRPRAAAGHLLEQLGAG